MQKKRLNIKSIYYLSISAMLLFWAGYQILKWLEPNLWQASAENHEIHCDIMPEFPGGANGIKQFLAQNIAYPEQAKREHIDGKVTVRFRVEADGQVKDVSILESKHPLLDSEAMRVIRMMPKWKPAMLKNEPVAVYMMQPVIFRLHTPDTSN